MIRVDSERDQVNVAKVYEAGQEQIFEYWDEIDADERRRLLDQIASVDFAEFTRLVRLHLNSEDSGPAPSIGLADLEPAVAIALPSTPADEARRDAAIAAGVAALENGEVGILLVAGGQGTRLQFDGPKGKFPIGPVSQRSLFQFHAEKTLALKRRFKRSLPWFIMTSESNHEETVEYFQEHQYFGLSASDVSFRRQAMLPIVDPRRGKILLRGKSDIALSPNGHGGAISTIRSFRSELEKRGVRYVFTYQVDNPLVRMCDPAFLGHHILGDSDFSSKATPKSDPDEKVGVFCRSGQETKVVEYTELSEKKRHQRDVDGQLSFRAGNIAIHVISTDFLFRDEDGSSFKMPYHVARKAISYMKDGELVESDEPNSIRFESFLFDVLHLARNPVIMEVDRTREFAPVKNLDGADSPATARALLENEWARWLERAEIAVPRNADGTVTHRIEISPLFATGPEECAARVAPNTVVDGDLLLQ